LLVGVIVPAICTALIKISFYCACIRISSGKLIVAEIFEIPSMILIESFEAVVDVDGSRERAGEGESDLTRRSHRVISIGCAWSASIIILNIDLLRGWSR
jgi:hypothetical protein